MKRLVYGIFLVAALTLAACGDEDSESSGSTGAAGQATAGAATSAAATTAASTTASKVALDTSFGTNGIASVPMSANENDRFMAVTYGPDGAIYAAGFVAQSGDHAMALAKFSANGAPDKSFGKDGVAAVNVAAGGKTAELARAVVVQPSGKIVIAGPIEHDTAATGDAAKDTDIAVLRFDNQGKLDSSFGREGIARIDLGTGVATSATAFVGDTSWGLGTLPGDKIVIFGSALTHAGGDRTDTDFVLSGLTSAGAVDTAFGNGGKLVVDLQGSADNPRHVTIQPDGKILATGYSRDADGVVSPVIIRATAAGVLDHAFGNGGVATAKVLPGVAESYAVAIQGDSYVTAGYGRGADAGEKVDLIASRFKADGSWDKSFGSEGVTRVDLAKEDDRARNVIALPDGRILAVGSGKMNATNVDSMVVLLGKDGAPDSSFGTSGYVLSDLGGPADAWYGVALSPDKKSVIVAGYKGVDATSGGNDDAVLTRINL
jgi:uncharacterized delta-60 repeat protein